MRYKHDNYIEQYLSGKEVTVAYNPDDVSFVWVLERGKYIRFMLIESRFKGKSLQGVQTIQEGQKELVKGNSGANLQAQIQLANHIGTITNTAARAGDTNIKGIRNTRQREQNKSHIDFMKGGAVHE